MKKKIIGILDREQGYTARLRDVFNSKNRMGFQAEMFTGVDVYLDFARKQQVEILLIGESLMDKTLKNTAELTIVLSEGTKVAEQGEYRMVYKYQSSELIIRKVLEYYAAVGKNTDVLCRTDIKLYGVYAPQGRSCKSNFAWNLAKHLSRDKQVLYISLNAFCEMRELYAWSKDLADIMYYIRNGFDNLIYLVGSSVMSREGVDCLPAVQTVDDLLHIPCEDWLKLLQVISTQSNYDAVVIDLEECVQQFYRILEYCTDVYLPYEEGCKSTVKWELCEEYFKKVGAEDVWKKGKKPVVDANNWRDDMENILKN